MNRHTSSWKDDYTLGRIENPQQFIAFTLQGILDDMAIKTLFFDLDDTLYPPSSGVWPAILKRIEMYMHERLNIAWEDIPRLRSELFQKYGTTLRGLQILWHVDELEFVEYVHDVPVDQLLLPDPALRAMLLKYPQRKYIFTNADRNHAKRVLNRLGIADCFKGIIDILAISPYCKPMPEAFTTAMRLAGVSCASECLFIDDGINNLLAARSLGFYTVQVGSQAASEQCHASIPGMNMLPQALDLLLETD
jgi:pyrimidine 5'-nucleotidase